MRTHRVGLPPRLRRLIDAARYRDVLSEGAPWPPADSRAPGREALIRRAAWQAGHARFSPVMRLVVGALRILAWPALTLGPSRVIAQRRGEGWRGAFAVWRMAMRSGVTPLEQYAYRIAPGCPAEANRWFMHAEFCYLNTALSSDAARELCQDKVAFAGRAAACGLAVPATLATVEAGQGAAPPDHEGGIVVKPVRGFGARGIEAWCRGAASEAAWQRVSGEPMALEPMALGARIGDLARRHGAMLIQPLIPAHPALTRPDIVLPPLLRIVSGLTPEGQLVIGYATLWYSLAPRDAAQVTGITVIDVASGKPTVTGAQARPLFDWMAPHPAFGRTDAALPFWAQTLEAVGVAHRMLEGGAPVIAWDVVISPQGPVLLEGNIGISLYYQQLATGLPGSDSALGAVVEAWLDHRAMGAPPGGGPASPARSTSGAG